MTEETTYIGRVIDNITSTRFENDEWTVIISVVEKRTLDFENWDERKLEVMSTSKSEEHAFTEASQGLLELLYENGGTLFNEEKPVVHDLEIQDGVLGSTDTLL